ncbi:MAG: DUF4830 domain-containing protein, partial [Eubacteriales bacterium]|nr:DUF4830 domain-containing protein [Eubacteriales bacterium]
IYLYTLLLTILALTVFAFSVFAKDINSNNIEFLASYGWIVSSTPTERTTVILPVVPDDVFNAYNKLQQEAGLNLNDYYGKHLTRYTYIVLNYPEITGETVFANLLLYEGKIVAGDIMTVSSDGFMHSLNFPVS